MENARKVQKKEGMSQKNARSQLFPHPHPSKHAHTHTATAIINFWVGIASYGERQWVEECFPPSRSKRRSLKWLSPLAENLAKPRVAFLFCRHVESRSYGIQRPVHKAALGHQMKLAAQEM